MSVTPQPTLHWKRMSVTPQTNYIGGGGEKNLYCKHNSICNLTHVNKEMQSNLPSQLMNNLAECVLIKCLTVCNLIS